MENTNLIKAVLAVMKEVKGIEKSMTVGTGQNAYKAVSDKDVKLKIGESMEKNGLIMLPIDIKPTLKIDRWEETTTYNGQPQTKQKQAVFTEVITEYLLCHSSGESMKIMGYGHGIDTQDKSAGKATTYALKNAMLYTFLVPTGTIDDTDKTHSDNIEAPKTISVEATQTVPLLDPEFKAMLEFCKQGKIDVVRAALPKYTLLKAQKDELDKYLNK
jgi:hypothetical protein